CMRSLACGGCWRWTLLCTRSEHWRAASSTVLPVWDASRRMSPIRMHVYTPRVPRGVIGQLLLS
ncbi:hypothetical protein FOZ62_012574, partial [Perkinsus olseni]